MNKFYFAYGSNMNPDRIRERIPQARLVGRAVIKGWRLRERLYADIERAKGCTVEGVLYLVTDTELYRLDAYEGFPRVYGGVQVNAWLDAKHCVYAVTYAMTEATKKEREGKPYPRGYRLLCSAGAHWHGVKNEYRRKDDPPFGFGLAGCRPRSTLPKQGDATDDGRGQLLDTRIHDTVGGIYYQEHN